MKYICGFYYIRYSRSNYVTGMKKIPLLAKRKSGWCRLLCLLLGVQINGGEGGIRTPDPLSGILAFQASALGHYATSPEPAYSTAMIGQKEEARVTFASAALHHAMVTCRFATSLPAYASSWWTLSFDGSFRKQDRILVSFEYLP